MVELQRKEREPPVDVQLVEQKRVLEQLLAEQKRALQSAEQKNGLLTTRVQVWYFPHRLMQTCLCVRARVCVCLCGS